MVLLSVVYDTIVAFAIVMTAVGVGWFLRVQARKHGWFPFNKKRDSSEG